MCCTSDPLLWLPWKASASDWLWWSRLELSTFVRSQKKRERRRSCPESKLAPLISVDGKLSWNRVSDSVSGQKSVREALHYPLFMTTFVGGGRRQVLVHGLALPCCLIRCVFLASYVVILDSLLSLKRATRRRDKGTWHARRSLACIDARAVMIPTLDPDPELHFQFFLHFWIIICFQGKVEL